MKRTVREFMRQRNLGLPEAVNVNASLREVVQAMRERGEDAVLVSHQGRVRGILTSMDVMRHFTAAADSEELSLLRAKDVMTIRVFGATPDYTLEQCLALMIRFNIRHLPVVDGSDVICLLTISQIASVLVEDKDFMIGELVRYISGPTISVTENFKEVENPRPIALC